MAESLVERFVGLPDLHQNPRYSQVMADIGWTTVGDPGSYLYIRRLGPLHIGKIQRPTTLDLTWLREMRKKHHLLTTYVEPGLCQPGLSKHGFYVEPFAHSATSIIDLTLSKGVLLSSLKSKVRYNISLATRQGRLRVVTKEIGDLTKSELSTFFAARASWSRRKNLIGYDESLLTAVLKNFTHSGWIHFAYQGDLCVALLLVVRNGDSAIYYSAFAEVVGYSLFAPTLLTWTAMEVAKSAGCTIFDFGGVYDPRYPSLYKKWQGFTRFKDGFSPTVVTYPRTQLLLGW